LATLLQGVEGVFRASCERSLAVLRANKEALLTVLEVMLHDPLYNWSVGPGKAAAKQAGEWKKLCDEDGGQKNKGNRQVALIHLKAVLRIHDILGWIRIRGSMPLTNGSGSCYFCH
jgi:ataxia telangiectasia mutated family protein